MLVRRTMRTRLTGKIREVTLEMRRRMHQPIARQGRWLEAVVRGHYAYYGVPGSRRRSFGCCASTP
jgi:RNA-directed DNA polymerase